MGDMGGSFGQAFAQTLMQGHQIIEQVKARRDDLELKKKLADVEFKAHELKTEAATRQLSTIASLQSRLQPQTMQWPGSELEAGGTAQRDAPPLTANERLRYAMGLDPTAAAKELVKQGESSDLMAWWDRKEKEEGGGAAPSASPSPLRESLTGAPPAAEMPVPSGPAPGPAAAAPASPGLGPIRKLDRSRELSQTDDGKLKLTLKVGERNVNFKLDHEAEPLADGRVQNYRVTTNPEDTRQEIRVPVGEPQWPAAMQAYASAATSWGLKPGSEMHGAAVADQAAVATQYKDPQVLEEAMGELAAYYRAKATARPAGAAEPEKPTTSPRARVEARQLEQLTKKAAAEAGVKTAAQQDAPIGDDATRYVYRKSLQHPDPSRKRKDIEGDPNLVQLSPEVLKKLPQILTTRASLDRLEEIVLSSPYWPASSGNAFKDIGLVAAASVKYTAQSRTDPRIGEVESLKITMPGTIKLFGDSGNISEAERAMAESALGLQPSTREQAIARIDAIRSMVDNTVEPMGLGPFPKKPGPKPQPSKLDQIEPNFILDLKTGKWMPMKRP